MDECKLEWKKVFKEILGVKSEVKKSEDSPVSISLNVKKSDNELGKNSINTANKTLTAISTIGEEHFTKNVTSNKEYHKENYLNVVSHSKFKKSIDSPVSFSSNVKRSDTKLSKNCVTSNKTSTAIPTEHFAKNVTSRSHVKQTKSLQDLNLNNEVPQWNNAFKCILGNTSAKKAQEQKDLLKEHGSSLKKNEPLKSRKPYRKKKQSNPKFKIDEEEEKVREMFARSRLFKLESPFKSPNDVAGSGVDIFKCDKKMFPPWVKNTKYESESDDDSSEKCSKLNVPVKGLIAKMKTITNQDILNAPCIPFTEAWDDDLLF